MYTTIIICAVLVTALAFGVACTAALAAGKWDQAALYFGLSLANGALTWMSRT